MAKEYCDCGQPAKWCYAPGYSSGSNPYSCDDCITTVDSMGCSCNWERAEGEFAVVPEGIEGKDWKWVVKAGDEYLGPVTLEDKMWVSLDPKGRPWPCCEYDYDMDENNFDYEDDVECNNCGNIMSLTEDKSVYACYNSECTSCYEEYDEDFERASLEDFDKFITDEENSPKKYNGIIHILVQIIHKYV